MEIYRNEIFKIISWNQNKWTKTCLQKLKDSFEKMDTYMKVDFKGVILKVDFDMFLRKVLMKGK